ncbi:tetratricopeptide repeat domain 4 [Strigomonas culicis]|uniref:Tetratricopeptide repeat domain 4 n=1 Tax=Strigomonas culicis TaxID=28005 RepID=S9W3G7_9TRYP|nr:tetratricopeptide repeat domain 4 [Strigomonas culicis]|eukprot:EPY33896.1 tetratricopeptide repeat domain 4 [Strigomonas culicis]
MLRGLVQDKDLSNDQLGHIDTLQAEIDEIWNRKGDYKIDPDAWEDMPIFMEHISEEDIEKNTNCAALASIVYDEMPADEVAENRKDHGNRALKMALNPTQENRENLARAAAHSYTEALQAKGKDKALTSVIYANRALAQFIIGNYGHGLEDAQRAVLLWPSYQKAYYRAAKCAAAIKKFALALEFISKVRDMSDPPLDATAEKEFEELRVHCRAELDKVEKKKAADKRKEKVSAVKVSNIARAITSEGIQISGKPEVSSEQMNAYGNPKPYIDENRMLHVPILWMYDEYSQTDMTHDVICDASVLDVLADLLPFPWDDRGRYASPDRLVVFYKVDDGVKVPAYYEVHLDWPLLETFRSETYRMPGLMAVLHVVCKDSPLLEEYKVQRLPSNIS